MSYPEQSQSPRNRIPTKYQEAVQAGKPPNRQKVLERFPQLANELQAFFAEFDMQTAQSNQAPNQILRHGKHQVSIVK